MVFRSGNFFIDLVGVRGSGVGRFLDEEPIVNLVDVLPSIEKSVRSL